MDSIFCYVFNHSSLTDSTRIRAKLIVISLKCGIGGSCKARLKVLGKSVGLCKTTRRKDQLHISLLVFLWRIICENFYPNGLILAEI